MSSTREAIKCSLLQLKSTRRTGTLRKKTKPLYGDPAWVVLCVHDEKIPCLEWYHTEESVVNHQPFKVIDLLYVTYVNHILGDPRTFVIGLSEVEPLELVALQPVTTTEWIEVTTDTLKRLLILADNTTNIYEAGTSKKEDPSNRRDLMDMSQSADRLQRILRHSRVSFDGHTLDLKPYRQATGQKPALPPRAPYQSPMNRFSSGSYSDVSSTTANGCLSPGDEPSVTPRVLSPVYDMPRPDYVSGVATPPRSPRVSQSVYDTLSPRHSSPLQSTISTNSLCSSLSSELRLSSTTLPHPENSDYDYPRDICHTALKYVSLNLSVIIEHLLLVDIKGRLWVAGWSEVQDKQLNTMLNFGDELIEVEGHIIKGTANIPQIFYNVSSPGTPISLVFRQTPFGRTYNLVKPIRKDKDIGIRLHKHKNRIADVAPDSSASRRGVLAQVTSAFHGEHQSSAVITEVAGRRLNPFARNDQFLQRYEEVREGAEFTISTHPHDFMKEMKQQLTGTKNYKAYLPSL